MSDGIRIFSAGPLSVIAFIILVGLLILIIPLFILGIIGAAFTRLGFSWISALAVVLLMLSGSFVTIPVYRIRRDIIRLSRDDVPFHGTGMPPAPLQVWETRISLNLGGAVIPACVSIYMIYRAILISGTSLLFSVCVGIFIVAAITFVSTRLVAGAGFHVPLLLPGLTALLAGLILTGGTGLAAAVTAFVSGTIGTLSGGNIVNLFQVKMLEIPDFSIGGAGTFGTVFICCILPALIA
ncbi:MAG: DUF1614 domain-containing protein [Methanoregula sp.]|nr:DUF1614 domain-containing protein [Methanoregula sp.]